MKAEQNERGLFDYQWFGNPPGFYRRMDSAADRRSPSHGSGDLNGSAAASGGRGSGRRDTTKGGRRGTSTALLGELLT
jgi:hypothetical protein